MLCIMELDVFVVKFYQFFLPVKKELYIKVFTFSEFLSLLWYFNLNKLVI